MIKTKISLLLLFLTFSLSSAFSHALWLETSSIGKKGQAQTVKIFFGEYESKAPDSAKKWFSNLKDFKLVLTAPNGSTTVLAASPDVLFFKASFTPDQDGAYKLSIVHEVAAVYEHAKIEYYAFADVAIGNPAKVNSNYPAQALLTIQPGQPFLKSGVPASHLLIYNKVPFAKQKVGVVNPDGTKQEPETDARGAFTFQTPQKGNYFVEAFTEDKTPGTLNGKAYDKVWHLATYVAEVQ